MSQRRVHMFCDFDGTIAKQDMIGAIVRRFLGDTGLQWVDRVNQGELTVQQGVEQMFAGLRSDQYAEIAEYAAAAVELRAGFADFVRLCRQERWPLTVVSGGFDFFVRPALAAFAGDLDIVCNRLDSSGETLRVQWHTLCDEFCTGGCGLCKPTVMRQRSGSHETPVVIGDGVTDVKAARLARWVYARDKLRHACDVTGIPYTPFETFHDVCQDAAIRFSAEA